MAADLARRLAPDGRAVLSGLLRRQEPIVLAPHRGCAIVLDHRLVIDGWSTLVMRRRHGSEMTMGAEAPISEIASAGRPLRPPSAERALPGSGRAPARMDWARGNPRRGWQFASGEPDVGERVVVERHQLGIGLLPVPPLGKAPSGGDEKIDYRHG
jgi:hypothetical protein